MGWPVLVQMAMLMISTVVVRIQMVRPLSKTSELVVPCWLWMGRVLEVPLHLVAFCLAEAVERVAWGCLRCACCLCEGDEVVLVVGRRSMGSRAVS